MKFLIFDPFDRFKKKKSLFSFFRFLYAFEQIAFKQIALLGRVKYTANNCSGIAMWFHCDSDCSETLQSAEVDNYKFWSDLKAIAFAVNICRKCNDILLGQNWIELLQL